MPKRYFHDISDLRNNLHKGGASIIQYGEKKIPCIHIEPEKYSKIIQAVAGRKFVVDILLDIFSDGRQIFIDVFMNYVDYGFSENYLLYANQMPEFFKCLAETGIIAISPYNDCHESEPNILLVQIPKVTPAEEVYAQIIETMRKEVS